MTFDEYIEDTLPDTDRTPIDTVVEFVKVYQKWAKDCHYLVKADKTNTKIDELARIGSEARKVLREIFNKYCSPKNRQYSRTHKGYFYLCGTYDASSEITACTYLTKNKTEIETAKIKNVTPAKKYIVIKQGQVWKIDSVERFDGTTNKWITDML